MQIDNTLEKKFKSEFKKPSAFSSQIRGKTGKQTSTNLLLILLFFLLIIGIIAVFYYISKNEEVEVKTTTTTSTTLNEVVEEETETNEEEESEEENEEEEINWETYKKKDWGITFNYTGTGSETKIFENPNPQNPYEAKLQYRVNDEKKDNMVINWTVWENKGKLTLKGFFDEYLRYTMDGCKINEEYKIGNSSVIRCECDLEDTFTNSIVIFAMDSNNRIFKISFRSKNSETKSICEEAIKTIELE